MEAVERERAKCRGNTIWAAASFVVVVLDIAIWFGGENNEHEKYGGNTEWSILGCDGFCDR